MFGLLTTLLGGLRDVGPDAIRIIRARIFGMIISLFIIILFAWMMSYLGHLMIDVAIWIGISLMTIWYIFSPEVEAAIATIEVFRGAVERIIHGKGTDADKALAKPVRAYYLVIPGYILFWTSIIMMFITTVPFGWYLSFSDSLYYLLVGLMFISVIAWASFFKWTKRPFYKKVIATYAIVGLIVVVWIFVPGSMKKAVFGSDGYGAFGTSETKKALAKVNRMLEKAKDEDTAEKILDIGKRKAEGKELTPEETRFWENEQAKYDQETIPNSWHSGSTAEACTTPPAPAMPTPPAPKPVVPNYPGTHNYRIYEQAWDVPAAITVTGDSLSISEIRYPNGERRTFEFDSANGTTYVGRWKLYRVGKSDPEGNKFEITFDPRDGSFTGDLFPNVKISGRIAT